MARQKHLEPVTGGLWTARDAAYLPPGALVEARNLRYKPGDVAVFQAEGREELWSTNIWGRFFAPLVWDPGTHSTPERPDPYQIIYLDASSGSDYRLAMAGVSEAGITNTQILDTPERFAGIVGQSPWHVVNQVDRANGDLATWFVFAGGKNFALVRGAKAGETIERFVTFGTDAMVVHYTTGGGVTYNEWYYIPNPVSPEDTPPLPLLSAASDTIVFALREQWTRLYLQPKTDSSVIPAVVWEYWSPAEGSWQTLTVLDGTGTLTKSGMVSWTAPDDWESADVTDVYTPPDQTQGQWFFVRVRRTGTVGGRRYIQAPPVGSWQETPTTQTKNQRYLPHGIPESDLSAMSLAVVGGGTTLTVGSRYWYWWVWADKTNGHAGTAADRVSAKTSTGSRTFELTVDFSNSTPPPTATHVYLYRGVSTDAASGKTSDPYPTGVRVYELPLAAIDADSDKTWTFTDNGVQVSSDLPAPYDGTQQFVDYGDDMPAVSLTDPVTGLPIVADPRDAEPPNATTATVFQGSLLLNDTSDPRKVRFSYPEHPHSFPSLFYFNIDTPDNDRVVALRSLGRYAGILTTRGLWRINWLPHETDEVFQREEALSKVQGSFGALSNRGVCTFTMPGAGEMVAWVGADGVYASDLLDWRELTVQFDWDTVRSGEKILVNNPLEYRLEMYVAGTPGEVWYIHYHPTLVSNGILPITGPMERPGGLLHAAGVWVTDTTFWPTTGVSTAIYREGVGDTDAATGDKLVGALKTRELYLAGFGEEFKSMRVLMHVKDSWVTNPIVVVLSSTDSKPTNISLIRTGSRRLEHVWNLNKVEFLQFTVAGQIDQNIGMSFTTIGLDWTPLGAREAK